MPRILLSWLKVIAKIPYRLAGLRHYATASEAATLHFLHSKGIPIPKLYGHSSSEDNPVGVEYIIIEKVRGVSLQSRWHTFSKQELHRLASTFIEIKKKLFNIPFGLSGVYTSKRMSCRTFELIYMWLMIQMNRTLTDSVLAQRQIICFSMGKELI